MVGISLVILSGAMYRNHSVATLNQRNNEYYTCQVAAEAAVEKVYARMAYDFQAYGSGLVNINLDQYRTNTPLAAENAFWSRFMFSDGQGNAGRTYISYVTNYTGPLPSAYSGLLTARSPIYRIISNVKLSNSNYGVVGTAQEDVLLALVPLNTWAIFYNGLLEFSQCAPMVVNGPVMANGSIYVGTSSSLTFNGGVSTTATLTAPLVDGLTSGWTPSDSTSWKTTFNGSPAYTTNVASVSVSLAMTNSHAIIDLPDSGEDPLSTLGQQRLYNQAQMVLIVTNPVSGTNPTVVLTLQSSVSGQVPGNDSGKVTLTYTNASQGFLNTNLPFLSLTNRTYDQRERSTNLFTQINVGTLKTWLATNATVQSKLPAAANVYPTILYVADQRTMTSKILPAVRLVNGAQLPDNNGLGFSVATPNPLYVQGNYNVTTSAGTSLGSNNLYEVPAALMSDALTILSANWTDSQGYTAYNNSSSVNDAADTTLNAAIVTGTMPSTGTSATTFSGGVHNLPRLLEDWAGKNLNLNTSILRLWNSNMATNQFRNPQGFSPAPVNPYYNPPNRNFFFDVNFLNPDKVPPGIPVALVPIRFGWGVPPPATTTYTPPYN
jgi:hypothetical protein